MKKSEDLEKSKDTAFHGYLIPTQKENAHSKEARGIFKDVERVVVVQVYHPYYGATNVAIFNVKILI